MREHHWSRIRPIPVLVASLLLAACGGGGDGGASGGEPVEVSKATKDLFVRSCGSCHALADAGTRGGVGPSLDGQGFDADRVSRQIEVGGGAMPPNLLEGKEREAVAEYVADASQ